jgi:hypothetical protein
LGASPFAALGLQGGLQGLSGGLQGLQNLQGLQGLQGLPGGLAGGLSPALRAATVEALSAARAQAPLGALGARLGMQPKGGKEDDVTVVAAVVAAACAVHRSRCGWVPPRCPRSL